LSYIIVAATSTMAARVRRPRSVLATAARGRAGSEPATITYTVSETTTPQARGTPGFAIAVPAATTIPVGPTRLPSGEPTP
jgi:hypothetical protein